MESVNIQVNIFSDKMPPVEEMVQSIALPSCGGVSIFQGITRDNFKGKKVVKLSYECYEPMAKQEMSKISQEAIEKFGIKGVAMWHRIGDVPVLEASVNIVTVSEHRKECIQATEWCIDQLKSRVPIWKKEFYEDGTQSTGNECCEPEWKKNPEYA